ncbi:MAG TPA: hypothetical protein VFZ76_17765, partial [Anaerolineales bacterium]
EVRAYKPSWIDRFNNRARQLPTGAWLFYVLTGLALIAVQVLILWLEGGLGEAGIVPVIVFNGLFTPFLMALIYHLDNQAVSALHAMRAVLDTSEAEFERYAYRLANMPAPLPLAAGLAVVVMVILMERLWTVPASYAALEQLPVFAAVFQVVDKSSAFLFGAFIYHTIRQLRLVNAIHAKHIRVNLFNLGPLRAFSGLTASTAVGLVIGVYGWMLINPELLTDPLIFGFAVAITILALFVFVWPLFGVHRRMQAAKEGALREMDLRFEAVFSKFDQRFGEEDYAGIERLNGTIASLEIQQRKIKAIATWPWRPDTVRSVLAAIALPLVLTVIQYVVERAFNQ